MGKLIDCPDCGQRVSRRAPTCPGCGTPIAPIRAKALGFLSGKREANGRGSGRSLGYGMVAAILLLVIAVPVFLLVTAATTDDSTDGRSTSITAPLVPPWAVEKRLLARGRAARVPEDVARLRRDAILAAFASASVLRSADAGVIEEREPFLTALGPTLSPTVLSAPQRVQQHIEEEVWQVMVLAKRSWSTPEDGAIAIATRRKRAIPLLLDLWASYPVSRQGFDGRRKAAVNTNE